VPRPLVVELLMLHAIGFVVGAIAFWAAHGVEAAHWHDWFHGEYEPWFLNSGRGILFTMGCVWLASALTAALNRSTRPVKGMALGGGACTAMTTVLFLTGPGPGTIFPIVLAAGGVTLLFSSVTGAWAGAGLRRFAPARR